MTVQELTAGQKQEIRMVEEEQARRRAAMLEQRREADRQAAPASVAEVEAAAGDAERRLPELLERRARLAPEAIVDSRFAAELADVESSIRDCQRQIDLLPVAREEFARRDKAARKVERDRAPHVREAKRLAVKRSEAALAVDKAAAEFAAQLRIWDRITSEQEAALAAAGRNSASARPQRRTIEGAIQDALVEASLPPKTVRLESVEAQTGKGRLGSPLADSDVRPIAPAEES